jgi:hypothetical protein
MSKALPKADKRFESRAVGTHEACFEGVVDVGARNPRDPRVPPGLAFLSTLYGAREEVTNLRTGLLSLATALEEPHRRLQ